MSWTELLQHNLDKLILLALIVFFTIVAYHIMHDMVDRDAVSWATGLVSGVVGALLTLITGNLLKSTRNPETPLDGKEKDKTE